MNRFLETFLLVAGDGDRTQFPEVVSGHFYAYGANG
jgi:hypothetical protein